MSSARELVLERDLVAPLLSPWLVPRDAMSLSETSKKCLREVRAGLSELKLNEKFGITDEHVITIVRCFPSLRSLSLNCDEDITGLIDLAMHVNDEVTAFAIAQLVVRSPGLVWLSTYNCPGWRDRGGKGHELARLLHEHLPNPARSHPRIMQFLPTLTLHS